MQHFSKAERLCSKIIINDVFETGKTIQVAAFKLYWLNVETQSAPMQILISVPKRNFKRAVDRNLLKRRIREAYRTNKLVLNENLKSKYYALMLVYTGKTILEYKEIEERIIELLKRFIVNTAA